MDGIFWFSLHQGTEESTTSGQFVAIPNFPPLQVDVNFGGNLLINLNVPDTWNDTKGAATAFGIQVDNAVVAQGYNTMAEGGIRAPVAVCTVTAITKGSHTVIPVWLAKAGRAYVGYKGTASLTAIAFPIVSGG